MDDVVLYSEIQKYNIKLAAPYDVLIHEHVYAKSNIILGLLNIRTTIK